MSLQNPVPATAQFLAVPTTSAAFGTALAAGGFYRLVTTTNMWVTQAASAAVATVGNGSILVAPGGDGVVLDAALGASVACIADTTAGHASLSRLKLNR